MLLTSSEDGMSHDIKSFMARPVPVRTGTWSSTDVQGTIIDSLTLPEDAITSSMLKSKVSGFYGFRAKAIVRLQVNTNRFQMGRLMMNFFPQATDNPVRFDSAKENIIFLSQLPRVDYDASSDTEAILEIPYINNKLYFNTQTNTGSMGQISLIVYSPLDASSGELTANYTIWVHFEDVKLEYPVIPTGSFSLTSQSGAKMIKSKRQISVKNNVDPVTKEQKAFGNGPISGFLGNVANVADDLVSVPALSWIAAPVSWAAALGSTIASAFGWSNPLNNSSTCTMSQMPMTRSMNCSGFDNSYNMGLFEDNSVEVLPGFAGTDVDEMSFAYILSIPTYIKQLSWTDIAPVGTILLNQQVGPSQFAITENISFNSTTVASVLPTPVTYMANFFKLYRGSIKLTFKVVKTEFHSGRLMISFVPGKVTLPDLTFDNMQYVHREILDLRYTNQVTVTCPWVSTSPYLAVDDYYGRLVVMVVNELRHPDTVPGELPILVEVNCDKDFEFAIPRQTGFELISNTSTALMSQGADVQPVTHSDTANVQLGTNSIGSAVITHDENMSSRACIGEKILSFRQLCKRAVPYYCYQTNDSTFYNEVRPNASVIPARDETAWSTNFFPDYLQLVGCLFAYQRGSVRLKIYNRSETPENRYALLQSSYTSYASTTETYGYNPPVVKSSNSVMPFAEMQIPFYSIYHSNLNLQSVSGLSTWDILEQGSNSLAIKTNEPSIDYTIFRQAGEDFSFGFFIGTQRIIPIQSTARILTTSW